MNHDGLTDLVLAHAQGATIGSGFGVVDVLLPLASDTGHFASSVGKRRKE
jgi:hypothetical protein